MPTQSDEKCPRSARVPFDSLFTFLLCKNPRCGTTPQARFPRVFPCGAAEPPEGSYRYFAHTKRRKMPALRAGFIGFLHFFCAPRTLAETACARPPRLTIFRVAGVRFGFRRLAKGQFPPRFRPFRGFRPLRDLRAAAPSHCARFDQPRPDFPGSAGRPTSCDAREAAQAGRGCPIFFPADFLFKPLLAKLAKRCRAQRKEQLVSTHAGPNTSKITTSKTDIPGD